MLSAKDRLILALDVDEIDKARSIIDDVVDLVGPMKIGLEAISSDIAHSLADIVVDAGGTVMWDGKWKDIPNTCKKSMRGFLKRHPSGIWAVTMYEDSGMDAVIDVVEAADGVVKVLAVTALTSLDEEETLILHGASVKAVVLQRAREAKLAGADVVCSPREAAYLKSRRELRGQKVVTPSIRPDWAVPQDQKRPTTPKAAILAGADFIVVGRPITEPSDGRSRREAAQAIVQEIEEALLELAERGKQKIKV